MVSCSPHCILPGAMWLTSGTLRQMYDCYVIGSGPAGITLALELAKANKKVLLFESGTAIDFERISCRHAKRHQLRTPPGRLVG